MKNTSASPEPAQSHSVSPPDTLLEQQVQHMLVAVEHELRNSPAGTDELSLIKKLQNPPWNLIGELEFSNIQALYPVHFLLFHVLYRLRDTLAEGGESLTISPLSIAIGNQDTIGGTGLPGSVDSLRGFYLDLSQYQLPEEVVQQMMDRFWAGYRGAGPGKPETLKAARVLGFDSVPDSFHPVKQAFRRAVMHAHPDRGGETEAIQSLNEAFAVLKAHFSQMMEQT